MIWTHASFTKAARAEASVAVTQEDFFQEVEMLKDAYTRAGICVIHQDLIWGWRIAAFPNWDSAVWWDWWKAMAFIVWGHSFET